MKRILSTLLLIGILISAGRVFAEEVKPAEAPTIAAPAPAAAPKADPAGANAGGIGDVVGYTGNGPTAEDMKTIEDVKKTEPFAVKVADAVGKNRNAINIVWTLVCGFLVMFMQAGFAMAETGSTQAKNAGHTMAMNFMVYGLGLLGFWLTGLCPAGGRCRAVRNIRWQRHHERRVYHIPLR